MEFGLLGPLRIGVGGHAVAPGPAKHRILLATLLLSAGHPVPMSELVDAVWGSAPPTNPRKTVRIYVARLRTWLEEAAPGLGACIVTCPDGYRIDVGAEQVDVLRFRRRLDDADRAAELSDPDNEAAALADALAEWRGAPLSDVPSELLQQEVVPRLNEERLRALDRRIDIGLRRGRHTELVGELTTLTAQYPMRERLWAQLMTALHGSGRRADALATYQTARRHLADELGVDPGEELQRLHLSILTDRRPTPGGDPVGLPVPRQLPPDVHGFTGRDDEITGLDALLDAGRTGTGTVVVSAIAGTAGVGKTALAVHWARRVADAFPDGQLWVNLRGYHPGQATTPGRALTGFLRVLGVPGEQIPLDLDEQTALYRSLLDGRRMLVVLDNARSSEQVRPLLPGAPGCFVVVTSRNQLTGLIAAEGARSLVVDLLRVDEARRLLAHRLGADRIAAEPSAADEIVRWCARLPLALAIAAARAATRPTFPLETLAAQLRDETTRLDMFASDGPGTDARAVFSWSYQALSPAAARLFRLLGRCPGPDISAAAAASLVASSMPHTASWLAELCGANLLTEHAPGRYSSHDLLRTYANELAHSHDDETERNAGLHRLLDHYLHTGYAAARLLNPHRHPITLDRPQPGVAPENLADYEHALSWFTSEHAVLLAVIEQAATAGFDAHVWQVAWATTDYLYRRGYWHDWLTAQHTALEAAQRLSDESAQAMAHRILGMTHALMGRHADAYPHLRTALALYGRLDDPLGSAQTHLNVAALLSRQDRYTDALHHCRQALDGYVAAGDRTGQAQALNGIGWYHAQLGNHRAALSHCERALALQQELGDRNSEASTWDSLGYAHHRLGGHKQAIDCYERAIDLYEQLGIRYYQAVALAHLGDVLHTIGDVDRARTNWHRALTTLDELDHPEADQVRAKLAATGHV